MTEPQITFPHPPRLEHPPGSSLPARRLVRRALAPVERFLHVEASSGIVLLLVAVIALVWANSPWARSYAALWHLPLGFRLGPLAFERDLHFWVNEGLMTIFFFVVGLEIRREIDRGELSEIKRAALPFAAALGGMLAPAILFFVFNRGRASAHGWGTPMATDIAFAVGVLALLGKRVPPALRVLLLSLAVIDDVGAILVIALFYSSNLAGAGFVTLAVGFLAMLGQKRLGVRNPWAYVPAAAVAWGGAYVAGIHPTLSGVVVGLMTPATAWLGPERFVERADASVANIRSGNQHDEQSVLSELHVLDLARREAVSPLERIVHALHPWVAFGIMPLFALANAGVPLGTLSLSGDAARVFAGVGAGLVLGKPLGVLGLAWVAVRLGIAALPRGVTMGQLGMVGCVAGIGFTMALFIAELAFTDRALLETAKLAVLAASGVAGVLGAVMGLFVLPREPDAGAARTEAEAESRTEA
jgi:NhaA family Na+:H+ antiporter